MQIITQNLRHGGSSRIQALIAYVLSDQPDILVLTEFQDANASGTAVKEKLKKFKYHFCSSNDGKRNGVLVASKFPFTIESTESRKVQIHIEEYDLKVFGIYLPDKAGSEKDSYWKDVLHYAEQNKNSRALLIGDFNSCLPSDSENNTKYNAEDVQNLLDIGFVDTWAAYNKDGNRYTWWSNHGTGFRLDYLFISKALDKEIDVWHENNTKSHLGDNWLSDHCSLNAIIKPFRGATPPLSTIAAEKPTEKSFREKFQAKHRTADGHFVRSKAEMIIDNWLYMAEIVHAYERKLPIEEEMYCDFYLPAGKVYIEYWGYENNEKYLDRKKKKIALYKKYNLNLVQLEDKDILNLDDILPKHLLSYGVTIC